MDYWTLGYKAGLEGKGYSDNPYEGGEGSTPWAFGCAQGIEDRNVEAFSRIMAALRGENAETL